MPRHALPFSNNRNDSPGAAQPSTACRRNAESTTDQGPIVSVRQYLARVRAAVLALFGGGLPAANEAPIAATGPACGDAAGADAGPREGTAERVAAVAADAVPGFAQAFVREPTGHPAHNAPSSAAPTEGGEAASEGACAPAVDTAPARAAKQEDEVAITAIESDDAAAEPVVAAPDPDADKLLARSALLQGQMLDLSARLADMQHRVRAFEHQQYLALGEVLHECLRLRRAYLQLKAERSGVAADLDEARKAGEAFDTYRRTAEEAAQAPPALDADALDELRKLYRTAAMRCHPDRAAEADKASAHGFFVRVQEAYRARDAEALRRIVGEMKAGAGSQREGPAASRNHAGIRARVGELQNQVADLILAVQTLQLDRIYRQAVRIEDWDEYFAHARAKFEAECDALRAQIVALTRAGG